MMLEQHYDEEVLIALLDEQKPDAHLDSCETCKAALRSIRSVTSALHEDASWDGRDLDETPRPATRSALRAFASSVATEDAAAEPWVKAMLARPSDEWRAMVDAHPEWRTAGFVRKLVAATDSINFTAPTDAVELTKIGTEVAESLTGTGDRLAKVKASAWREYAYALYYVGSYNDSIRALDRTDSLLESALIGQYDRARSTLLRAYVLGEQDKFDESIQLTRQAKSAFSQYGERRRVAAADLFEGATLIRLGRFTESLQLQLALLQDHTADEMSRACFAEHAAICYRELANFEKAISYFGQSIAAFEKLGAFTRAATAKWHLSKAFLSASRYTDALGLLANVRTAFESAGMSHNAAQAAIDTAESLLMLGRLPEVGELCRSAIAYFQKEQLTYTQGALTALAYLREAAEAKKLTLADIRDVRTFFEVLPRQPELLFAQPA